MAIVEKKLNAMVIGADRSGSTWLRTLCSQHPDIYVCPTWQREFLSKQQVVNRGFFSKIKFNCPFNEYKEEKIILLRKIYLF